MTSQALFLEFVPNLSKSIEYLGTTLKEMTISGVDVNLLYSFRLGGQESKF